MAVVLVAFDDSMKEVLALVNKNCLQHNINMHELPRPFIILAASPPTLSASF